MELKVTTKQLIVSLATALGLGTGGWFGTDAYNYVKNGVDNSFAITSWLTSNVSEKPTVVLRKADALDCLFPIPANATPETKARVSEICPTFLASVAERLANAKPVVEVK